MSTKDEVHRIKKKLDKIVSKEDEESQAMDLLKALKDLPIDYKVLSKTGIGQSVNAIRKASKDEDVQQEARQMIKSWKGLVPRDEKKEEKDDDNKKKKERKPEPKAGSDLMDEIRQKCCQMLADALKGSSEEELPDGIAEDPDTLAEKLEEEIFKIHKNSGQLYKSRVRSRLHNLKDKNNTALRINVLCGNIPLAKMARFTSEEMASEEMLKVKEKHMKENMDHAQLAIAQGTRTDLLQCGKCKKRDVTYNQMQTRSSDEPMTTFCLCNTCGNRWKFC